MSTRQANSIGTEEEGEQIGKAADDRADCDCDVARCVLVRQLLTFKEVIHAAAEEVQQVGKDTCLDCSPAQCNRKAGQSTIETPPLLFKSMLRESAYFVRRSMLEKCCSPEGFEGSHSLHWHIFQHRRSCLLCGSIGSKPLQKGKLLMHQLNDSN